MTVEFIAARLPSCRRLLFITGAGMSADSGLPTYRGVGGLYDGIETEDGMPIEQALSGAMMQARPEVCWRHILQIESACRGALPNPGHEVIARFAKRFDTLVLTQNVDGLHRAAGSEDIIDIHGDIRRLLCTACEHQATVVDYRGLTCPPRCPDCNAVLRPDVVLFGEPLPPRKIARLQLEVAAGFDAVFSVGTTSVFPYIAQPVVVAQRQGALTVEINPGRTVVSDVVEVRLEMGASDALQAIEDALTAHDDARG